MAAVAFGGESSPGVDPAEALRRLTDGNQRYACGKAAHPRQDGFRRTEVAVGQHPFAAVLSCSDSRVPPEVLFDQGLGDMFVVRTAGHVADTAALGSLEYAVEHLGVRLILVLGHQRCGAVQAALDGGEAPGHIAKIVEAILPAIRPFRGAKGDVAQQAVDANIAHAVSVLNTSQPVLAALVKSGKLQIAGARYDLENGEVRTVIPLAASPMQAAASHH